MNTPDRVVKELGAPDKAWLEKSRVMGRELLSYYANESVVNPQNLDKAFQKWKQDHTENRAPDEIVANGLGTLFGDYIVEHKICRWAIVTDKLGTELAIISSTGSEVYPINTIWKRIDPSDSDISFFEPIWTLAIKDAMHER